MSKSVAKKSTLEVQLSYFILKTVPLIIKIKFWINVRIIKVQMYSQFDQRKQFIVSWKKCIQQIDLDMVVKMIENLIPKVMV